jgi:hypothetical protein
VGYEDKERSGLHAGPITVCGGVSGVGGCRLSVYDIGLSDAHVLPLYVVAVSFRSVMVRSMRTRITHVFAAVNFLDYVGPALP